MKSVVFGSLFILIIVILLFTTKSEGFAVQYPTDPKLLIPKVNPPREVLTAGNFDALKPSSTTLLAPPPGGIAVVNSLPNSDPSQEKAPYARLKNALETAQGFLKVEAPKMGDMSDPSVQLPLTTLRADVRRLRDEIQVLERNPGIESSLTQADVDGIEANLAYLQKKWRAVANSLSGYVEGFQTTSTKQRASLSQLKDLVVKINVEINRLNASGTTDITVKNRVSSLKSILDAVQAIIDKVNKKQMAESEIPIMEEDYRAFLPVLSNPNSNLPDLLKDKGLPPSLASLFPAYQAGDISGAGIMQYLFKNYADTIVKGISWDLRMNYTSDRAKELQDSKKQFAMAVAASTLSTPVAETSGAAATTGTGTGGNPAVTDNAGAPTYRGEFASRTGDSMAGPTPIIPAKSGGAGHLDWKKRSTEICEAIRKRGYEPGDFGCLKPDTSVGPNFSYRGYAKMICSRLSTIYDVSAPEACGCPPITWEGWRL